MAETRGNEGTQQTDASELEGAELTLEGGQDDGNEESGLLSGEEQDDASGSGEKDGKPAEDGDAEAGDGDEEDREEVAAAPKREAPVRQEQRKPATAPRREVEPERETDPELAKIEREYGTVSQNLKAAQAEARDWQEFLDGDRKLRDGRTFDDLKPGEQIVYKAKLETALLKSARLEEKVSEHTHNWRERKAVVEKERQRVGAAGEVFDMIDTVVSQVDGLTDSQRDAAIGFVLRKSREAGADKFFGRDIKLVAADIKAAVGGGGAKPGKRSTALLTPKKPPASIAPTTSSGGRGSPASPLKGFTFAEAELLKASSGTIYKQALDGKLSPERIKAVKATLTKKG